MLTKRGTFQCSRSPLTVHRVNPHSAVICYAHSSYKVPISFQVKIFDHAHGTLLHVKMLCSQMSELRGAVSKRPFSQMLGLTSEITPPIQCHRCSWHKHLMIICVLHCRDWFWRVRGWSPTCQRLLGAAEGAPFGLCRLLSTFASTSVPTQHNESL